MFHFEGFSAAAIANVGIALAGLGPAAAIQPHRWVHVGGTAGYFEEQLDTESVARSGDKVTLWTRRNFAMDRTVVWHEIEIDCLKRTEAVLGYVRDDGRTVSHNIERPYRESVQITPGSVAERIFESVCR